MKTGPGDSSLAVMVLRSSEAHEAESSIYRHVEADTPKTTISADRFLVACGTRPVRQVDSEGFTSVSVVGRGRSADEDISVLVRLSLMASLATLN